VLDDDQLQVVPYGSITEKVEVRIHASKIARGKKANSPPPEAHRK
jgi:hypothetical protein